MVSVSPVTPAEIRWTSRIEPLPAAAVCAFGSSSRALAAATARASAIKPSLAAAAGDDTLLVVGDTEDLPWVDGAAYLATVGGVLMPCVTQPADEVMVVRAALATATADLLVAVLPNRILRIERPRLPIDVSRLTEHAGRWR